MSFRREPTDNEQGIDKAIRSEFGDLAAFVQDLIVLDMSMGGDSFFAEIILNDGTKIADAEKALLRLKSSLSEREITLDVRIAAEWALKTIEYCGTCRGDSGGVRAAEAFNAELVSGTARQIVTVEISWLALRELDDRLGATKPESFLQTTPLICEILRGQINHWLSFGGESRWNPVTNSVVRLSHLPVEKQTA
jgi:hypothetical protein